MIIIYNCNIFRNNNKGVDKIKSYIANANDEDVRISRFVINVTKNLPNSILHKSFRNKRVKVNKKAVKEDYRIKKDDLIELYINDEFFSEVSYDIPSSVKKINDNLMPEIIYEDENLIFVNKPTGLLCHSDNTKDISLIDILKDYLINKGDYSPQKENIFTPALCNRIDRGTNGIVICAKNYKSLRDMNFIISHSLLNKQYLCVVKGVPKSGIYNAYHKRNLHTKKVTISNTEKADYKKIKTGVTVLENNKDISLCKIDLYTGKTHQIRAHLAFLNHPLLGDTKYGNSEFNYKYKQEKQILSSYRVVFFDIPKENTLSYLSQKKFDLKNNDTIKLYNAIKMSPAS